MFNSPYKYSVVTFRLFRKLDKRVTFFKKPKNVQRLNSLLAVSLYLKTPKRFLSSNKPLTSQKNRNNWWQHRNNKGNHQRKQVSKNLEKKNSKPPHQKHNTKGYYSRRRKKLKKKRKTALRGSLKFW